MPEPTVLDYVKEKLTFWKKGTLSIPTLDELEAISEPLSEAVIETNLDTSRRQSITDVLFERMPWRLLGALATALVGQFLLEPNSRDVRIALVFYLISAGLVVWSLITRELKFTVLPADLEVDDPLTYRPTFALAGIPLALLTFLTFSSGLFDELNTLIWILAVLSFVAAVIRFRKSISQQLLSLRHWLLSWPKQFSISGWAVVWIAIWAIILFFRVYHLNQVPPEMTSDHAEKLQDVEDVINGLTSVFFPRNTGREAIQFYLTAFVSQLFGTGVTFLSMKIGTVLAGLAALPFIYLAGKEFGGKRIGLLALFLAGIAYWPNVISRVGLRFSLYPLFVAPLFYFLIHGLRTKNRNDFIYAGLALGMGLHGYSPYRIVPILVILAVIIYLLSIRDRQKQLFVLAGLIILVLISFVVFLPLFRYSVEHPDQFYYRALTRVADLERPLPGSPIKIFLGNLWNAMIMFGYSNGSTWLHSVPLRPALDVVSAALFYMGLFYIVIRFIIKRHWQDLVLFLSIPILMLPSILSLAFPNENPALNRTAGALIPVFIVAAVALDAIISGIEQSLPGIQRKLLGFGLTAVLLVLSMSQNYNLVFRQYYEQYRLSAGNTVEIGTVLKNFAESVGTPDTVWIIGYPNWVDTRLPAIVAGYPIRDYAIWPDQFVDTLNFPGTKLFIVNPVDTEDLQTLQAMYPSGRTSMFTSSVPGKDFLLFLVPSEN